MVSELLCSFEPVKAAEYIGSVVPPWEKAGFVVPVAMRIASAVLQEPGSEPKLRYVSAT